MRQEAETPLLLSRRETAALLRRTPTMVRVYERKGLLHPVRFGENGRPLYHAEEVEALIERQRAQSDDAKLGASAAGKQARPR